MKFSLIAKVGLVAVACGLGVEAEGTAAGWREAVELDEAALSSRLTIGEGGEAYKLGEGVATLSLANIDRQAPYAINVVSGRLDVVAGAATTLTDPPACIAEKAAFWVDATSGCGLQTEEVEGVTRVTRWCDRRESDPANRVYFSALPAHYATGHARENTANPLVTNVIGNACVSFGGVGSGQYMLFKTPADVTKAFTDVAHFFIVHGSYATWGAVLGYTENTGTGGFRANSGGNSTFEMVPGEMSSYFDLSGRGDQHGYLFTARYAQNGRVIDPFRTPPLRGFELLDATMNEGCQTFNNFFRQRREQCVVGGDYLSEAILFTNRLSAAEVAQIERYLMGKWRLTYNDTKVRDLSRDVGRLNVAANATVGVAPAAGEETGPLAFSGRGTVEKTGEGTLVIGPSGTKPPFAGTFALKEGRVAVRGGSIPALDVKGGDVLNARYTSTANSPTVAAQLADGNDLTLTHGDRTDVFRKTGDAEARVSSVAGGVRRIFVEGGSLVLAAKTAEPDPLGATPIKSVNVTIPNASFEDYFTDNPTKTTVDAHAVTKYGWDGSSGNTLRYFSVRDGGWNTYSPAAKYAPEGRAALMLKTSSASAYTTVTIDQPGEYEFSCCSTIRGNTAGFYPLGIFFGSTWAAATQVGTILNGKTPWPRTFCRFTVAAAGDYILGFKAMNTTSVDNAYMVDDLALRLVTEAKPTSYPVPNGDFESIVKGTTINTSPSTNMTLTGWTLDASGSTYFNNAVNSAVGAVSLYHVATSQAKDTYLSTAADKTAGNIQLLFIGTGGKATSAAFAPAAGTYRLQAKVANWNSSYYDSTGKTERSFSTGVPVVKVTLIRASGETVALGSVTPRGHLMSDGVWPVAFTVSADESVSLIVEQTTSTAAALLDDLTFVAADEADAGELVVNGGLEVPYASDGFLPLGGTGGSYICKNDRQFASASGTTVYFGYNLYEGSYQAQIGCNAGLYESVTFPSEGLYRLRFAAHSRTSTRTSHGLNPLHAYLQTSDGKAMVSDIVTVRPFGANYCEYSALFKVEAAGTYRFVMRGTSLDPSYKDRRSYVDGISIRKVAGTTAACPQIPADARLSVAEGARLQLDYTGSVRVSSLRLGGVPCSGTVSAATHPDYISGAGSIEIVPASGAAIILK